MRCFSCGKKLPKNARFCYICGTAVTEIPDTGKRRLSKQQLLKFGGIGAAVLAAVILVVVLATRPPEISIPDPEQFFGVSAIKGEHYDDLEYKFPVPDGEDAVWLEKVTAYAELLNSSEYPYVLKKQEEKKNSDSTCHRYYLEYTGPNAEDHYGDDVYINYEICPADYYTDSSVKIEFTDNYRFVFEDVEEFEGRTFPMAVEGPLRYLGLDGVVESIKVEDMADSGSILYTYVLSLPFEETRTTLQRYINAYLLGELALQDDGLDESDEGEYRRFFACPGAETYTSTSGEKLATSSVFVGCWKKTDTSSTVMFTASPSFTISELAPTAKESAPAQQAQAEAKPAAAKEAEDEEEYESVWEDCPSCYGGQCSACGGRGGKDQYSPGLPREWEECWKCHGDGDCTKCDGFGKVLA